MTIGLQLHWNMTLLGKIIQNFFSEDKSISQKINKQSNHKFFSKKRSNFYLQSFDRIYMKFLLREAWHQDILKRSKLRSTIYRRQKISQSYDFPGLKNSWPLEDLRNLSCNFGIAKRWKNLMKEIAWKKKKKEWDFLQDYSIPKVYFLVWFSNIFSTWSFWIEPHWK